MRDDAVKFDDRDKRIAELEVENAALKKRIDQLLDANNRELEHRRRKSATIKLIKDTVNVITDRELGD